MKIRTGFVSNSSSSSFVLTYKDDEALKRMYDSLAVPDSNPLSSVFQDVIDTIRQRIKDADDITTEEDLRKTWGDDYASDCPNETEALRRGWKVKVGSFCDEDDSLESFLCNEDINFSDVDFSFTHEGGY